MRLAGVLRFGVMILRVILLAGLVLWVLASPLVWILRDGLGPGMVESRGAHAAFKFAVGWGVPALALALPVIALSFIERRAANRASAGGRVTVDEP
jgi:hypothetical protein